MKKLIASVIGICLLVLSSTNAFAVGNSNIPENASVSEVIYEETTNDNDVVPYNTVTGDAGKSWIYLNRVSTLKSQAAFGIACKDRMDFLVWGLSYSDGNSASGAAFPISTDWSNENVQTHSSSGTVTVVFSATAYNVHGQSMVSLMPVSSAYIY